MFTSAAIVCVPPLMRMPALEPRLSNVSVPPLPGFSVTLLLIENTIVPTVIGASRLMLLDEVGDVRKLAVVPAPFGTCAGVVQLPVVLQLPPPARFQAEPKFGAANTNALS